ncbi:MAG: hypothetical protein DRG78_08405 [Epsilonproteobacteria bacterium]|nr:MAG: hypothetical protein DRG78_08405 [Campylobacterota bacterium]
MTQTTMVRRSREAKKASAVSVIAMKLAKDAEDPQQKKAARFKKLFVAAKEAILKKYGPRAKTEWTRKQGQTSQPKKK